MKHVDDEWRQKPRAKCAAPSAEVSEVPDEGGYRAVCDSSFPECQDDDDDDKMMMSEGRNSGQTLRREHQWRSVMSKPPRVTWLVLDITEQSSYIDLKTNAFGCCFSSWAFLRLCKRNGIEKIPQCWHNNGERIFSLCILLYIAKIYWSQLLLLIQPTRLQSFTTYLLTYLLTHLLTYLLSYLLTYSIIVHSVTFLSTPSQKRDGADIRLIPRQNCNLPQTRPLHNLYEQNNNFFIKFSLIFFQRNDHRHGVDMTLCDIYKCAYFFSKAWIL